MGGDVEGDIADILKFAMGALRPCQACSGAGCEDPILVSEFLYAKFDPTIEEKILES